MEAPEVSIELLENFKLPASGANFEDVTKCLVFQAITRAGGNISAGGRLLGMQRYEFRYKLDKYNMLGYASELATATGARVARKSGKRKPRKMTPRQEARQLAREYYAAS